MRDEESQAWERPGRKECEEHEGQFPHWANEKLGGNDWPITSGF